MATGVAYFTTRQLVSDPLSLPCVWVVGAHNLRRICGDISLFFIGMAASAADNLYSVLGVQESASNREIKLAYRQLARQLHPDRHVKVRLAHSMPNTS